MSNIVYYPSIGDSSSVIAMYDIFLSYSTDDRARLVSLVAAFEQHGWSVFWDHRSVRTGDDWREVIERAVCQCRCVVVAWSNTSIQSKWVKEEATEGGNRKVLLPIRIDDVLPPFGFREIQVGDFSCWNGKPDHPAFIELAEQISWRLNHEQQPSQEQKSGCGVWLVILIVFLLYSYNKSKNVVSTHTPVVITNPATPRLTHQPKPKDDLWVDKLMK